jgi:hypothetical protein
MEGDGTRPFVNAAGAAAGAMGAIDILLGAAMLAGAASYDATFEGEATALAMRSYGVRSMLAGGVCLAFVWAVFAEAGARPSWFLLPLGIALFEVVADLTALAQGTIPARTLSLAVAVHEVLAAAVGAVALAGWLRERAPAPGSKPG